MKKISPINEAINWCDGKLLTINSADLPQGLKEALLSPFQQLKDQLKPLLPKEKQFAEEAFNRAIENFTDDPTYIKRLRDFDTYYRQYENE